MKHVRPEVERFWDFLYRRAIGVSLVVFAILMAVGLLFTIGFEGYIGTYYFIYEAFWVILIVIMASVFAAAFAMAHVRSVTHMSKKEHGYHSVYMAVWLLALCLWAIVFVVPFLLFQQIPAQLAMLSFGGILLAAYLMTALLFEVYHNEIAYGAIILLVAFSITYFNVGGLFPTTLTYLSMLLVSSVTIIIVAGFTGIMLLMSSTVYACRALGK